MTGIVKEYKCMAHGYFESPDDVPRCPKGCTSVSQVFLTPRGLVGKGTKNIDATFDMIAKDFGLSDMNTHRGTTAARVRTKQQIEAEKLQEKLRVRFAGSIPKGGTYHAGERKAIGGGAGQGALAALAAQGAPETTVFSDVSPSLPDFKRSVVVTKDPDKSSIEKVRAA